VKNHSKWNKRAFFVTKKEFLIHKGEKVKTDSNEKGISEEHHYHKYIDCNASVIVAEKSQELTVHELLTDKGIVLAKRTVQWKKLF
jgi:hypothetical protein